MIAFGREEFSHRAYDFDHERQQWAEMHPSPEMDTIDHRLE
jgi:hypothetical protein